MNGLFKVHNKNMYNILLLDSSKGFISPISTLSSL